MGICYPKQPEQTLPAFLAVTDILPTMTQRHKTTTAATMATFKMLFAR
jgi:hypothetical protein